MRRLEAPTTGDGRVHCRQGLLATASDDRSVRIWDPATGQQWAALEGHTDWVNGVCAFTLDDQALVATASAAGDDQAVVATASAAGTVRIWPPLFGHQRTALEGHTDGGCAFTLCGEVLPLPPATTAVSGSWTPILQ